MGSDSAICRYRVKEIIENFEFSDLEKIDGTKEEFSKERNSVTRGGVSTSLRLSL